MQVKAITEQRRGQNWKSFDGLGRHKRDFGEKHAPDATAKARALPGVRAYRGFTGPWCKYNWGGGLCVSQGRSH